MNIEKIVSIDMDQNCYLVYDDKKHGAIIDPGFSSYKILKAIEEKNVDVKYILLTHCHYDHIFSVNKLRGHKIVLGTLQCDKNIRKSSYNLSDLTGKPFEIDGLDKIVEDGEEFFVGDIKFTAIKPPGHTDGSVCFLAEDNLFSGDTLFLRSVGRWDFPTGSGKTLVRSIKEKLYTLPDNINVFPGHGEKTTIGYEKKFNMYIEN